MKEYALSIFAICLVGGVLSLISHRSFSSAQRFVFGVILLYVALSPTVELARKIDPDDITNVFDTTVQTPEYSFESVAEQGFGDGIIMAVSDEFSLDKKDIRINIDGFDFENMRADRIRLVLSGSAAFSDYRAVESYVNKMNAGECVVEIEIG